MRRWRRPVSSRRTDRGGFVETYTCTSELDAERLAPSLRASGVVSNDGSNLQVVLDRIPDGVLETGCFRVERGAMPVPAEGQVVVRTILLSLDPANRAWMRGRTYRDQLRAGGVMAGFTLAEVVDPGGSEFRPGQIVACEAGWQEYAALDAAGLEPISIRGKLSLYLGALGITGLSAWFGLMEVGCPRPGETVLVSAAAGATGNVVGQLARTAGARVVGVTGSDEKNRMLEDRLGFDATVNHRDPDLAGALKRACPDGVDVYFDNVGGPVLDAVLRRMALRGRVVCCGAVSQYEVDGAAGGAKGVPTLVITRRLRLEGFIVLDYADRFEEARGKLAELIARGELQVLESVLDGLTAAPEALVGLLSGDNVGKRLVRVAPDPVGAPA